MILLSEVLGEARLNSSFVTCGSRGRPLMVRKTRFLAEVKEFYICTVEIVKKVCPVKTHWTMPSTRMHIITHTFTSVQFSQSMLLLSRFSRARLCATPETAAHQAPPSLGFSRQEHWSGLPLPSPMHEREKWKWSRSVKSALSDPMDCSLPGSSVHGIFQARVLEWGAIAFSVRKHRLMKIQASERVCWCLVLSDSLWPHRL